MTRKVGIIVEWDNARLSDVDRAWQMLRRLQQQTSEIADRSDYVFDLLLVYDPDEIPAEVPNESVAKCIDRAAWPGTVRVLDAPDLAYYEQKNFGVRQTDAEIIVFVDSDVVPDPGWLAQLVEALENPDVQIVGGETYLSTDTFYERLCAGFWNFDVRRPGDGIYEARNFYANNVALKRGLIERFPFPKGETYRGQCATLAKEMRASGMKLYRIRSAAVSHPPPEGLKHFVHRAICQGHDTLLNQKLRGRGALNRSPLGSALRFVRGIAKAPLVIWRRRRQAGLGPGGMLAAFGLSAAYSVLVFAGELATFVSPSLVRGRFSI